MRDINRLGEDKTKRGGNKYTDDMMKLVNDCVKLVKLKQTNNNSAVTLKTGIVNIPDQDNNGWVQ